MSVSFFILNRGPSPFEIESLNSFLASPNPSESRGPPKKLSVFVFPCTTMGIFNSVDKRFTNGTKSYKKFSCLLVAFTTTSITRRTGTDPAKRGVGRESRRPTSSPSWESPPPPLCPSWGPPRVSTETLK